MHVMVISCMFHFVLFLFQFLRIYRLKNFKDIEFDSTLLPIDQIVMYFMRRSKSNQLSDQIYYEQLSYNYTINKSLIQNSTMK